MKTFYLCACTLFALSANLLTSPSENSQQQEQYLAKCKCKDKANNNG